jgi:hypothetical protein
LPDRLATAVYHSGLLSHCSFGNSEESAQSRAKSYMDTLGESGDFVIEGFATGLMGIDIHYCLVAYALRGNDTN